MSQGLDNEFVLNYARPPSEEIRKQAIAYHQQVRARLGDTDYLTFLQGSYANDTALADLNDVDIVVVRRNLGTAGTTALGGERWSALFKEVEAKLGPLGPWKREDKCIRLNTPGVRVDIVPAIALGSAPEQDPIAVYSFRAGRQKKNWPRGHSAGGRSKGTATSGQYKQAVRLFKRWKSSHFSSSRVAPSYYVECLLHSLPHKLYTGPLANIFVALAQEIVRKYPRPHGLLPRIAGEGNLLTQEEWGPESFKEFLDRLAGALPRAEKSLREPDRERAHSHWRGAFNGR